MNYEYLKKCVSNAQVAPMSSEWWASIMDRIPDHLVCVPQLQDYIGELHNEVLTDFDKSIRKSMGMSNIYNSNCIFFNINDEIYFYFAEYISFYL